MRYIATEELLMQKAERPVIFHLPPKSLPAPTQVQSTVPPEAPGARVPAKHEWAPKDVRAVGRGAWLKVVAPLPPAKGLGRLRQLLTRKQVFTGRVASRRDMGTAGIRVGLIDAEGVPKDVTIPLASAKVRHAPSTGRPDPFGDLVADTAQLPRDLGDFVSGYADPMSEAQVLEQVEHLRKMVWDRPFDGGYDKAPTRQQLEALVPGAKCMVTPWNSDFYFALFVGSTGQGDARQLHFKICKQHMAIPINAEFYPAFGINPDNGTLTLR